MSVLIKDPDTSRAIRELASRTGETLTQAVKIATHERMARLPKTTDGIDLAELERVLARIKSYRITDDRTPDEILGYGEDGLP